MDARGRARVGTWNKYIDDVPTDAIKVPSYQYNLAPAIRSLSVEQLDAIRKRMPNRKTAERWLQIASDRPA